MFSSVDSKGCIKAFLWGWLSTGENHAGAPDQSIPGDLPTECHVLAQGLGSGWPRLCCWQASQRCFAMRILGGSKIWVFRGAPGWTFNRLSLSGPSVSWSVGQLGARIPPWRVAVRGL